MLATQAFQIDYEQIFGDTSRHWHGISRYVATCLQMSAWWYGLKTCQHRTCFAKPVSMKGPGGIVHVVVDCLLAEHTRTISHHCNVQQKRLSPILEIAAMEFRRLNTSSIYSQGKACKPLRLFYYNRFALSTN